MKMAILNPCCCISLRTGAKIVSFVDIIIALIFLIIFATDLSWNIQDNGKPSQQIIISAATSETILNATNATDECEDEISLKSERVINTAYVTTGVWTILIVFIVTIILISTLLFTGARNYSIKRCKWWFFIQAVITSISLIVLILIICFRVHFTLVILDLIHLIYRFYTLWVVYLFIGELTYLDTLCSLNTQKKGGNGVGGGIAYPTPIYTTQQQTYNNYPYQTWPDEPTRIGIASEQPIRNPNQYNSSDDGLPHQARNGGIDNPTYLP